MDDRGILLDTTILIDYFRKSDKEKTILYQISQTDSDLYLSTISDSFNLLKRTEKIFKWLSSVI